MAAAWAEGRLLAGYIDLVGVGADPLDVIDLKTDAPPKAPVEAAYPEYASQVRAYGQLLLATGVGRDRDLRCGLLFTADGIIRWVDPLRSPAERPAGDVNG